jgi:hypothetical protein
MFKVPVPGKGHENVGAEQEQDGRHAGSISDAKIDRFHAAKRHICSACGRA